MNRALISGASGQDSILLSQFLLSKGYEVFVTSRRAARPQSIHVKELAENSKYKIIQGDITDLSSIVNAIEIAQPDEFYNLAAQSHVGESFKIPLSTFDITGKGVANCLEAVRITKPNIRFYQASSSEQFGGTKSTDNRWIDSGNLKNGIPYVVLNEETPFRPKSPYACAKTFAHNITANYREAYGLHASCGILFNHESIYRKLEFVTRKVTAAVAEIHYGLRDRLELGTLNFARDWGWANDYVKAMWSMLQQPQPDDYVIATGKAYTGQELLEAAFGVYNMDWREYTHLNEEFSRPSDVRVLIGDASKAYSKLGFEPTITFQEMIRRMVVNDSSIIDNEGNINE